MYSFIDEGVENLYLGNAFFLVSIYMKSVKRVSKSNRITRKYKGGSPQAAKKLFEEFDKPASKFSLDEALKQISKLNEKSINKEDKHGSTLLHQAIHGGENMDVIVKLLVEKKADINKKDSRGRTALYSAIEFGNVYAVKLLLENGAKTDVEDKAGYTPLEWAETKPKHTPYPEIIRIIKEHNK